MRGTGLQIAIKHLHSLQKRLEREFETSIVVVLLGAGGNEVSRVVGVERGLLAYHLGILKATGIVSVDYKRRSRETSKYKVAQTGGELIREVFEVEPNKRHSTSRTKELAKNRDTPR